MSLRVNTKVYDWGDVDLKLPGVVTDIQEISYDDELEKELVYGHGKLPRGYGTGNYKANGKISMLRDDYEAILEYCNNNNIKFYDLHFPKIVVSYANGDGSIMTDVLNNVTFAKRSMKAANEDKSFKVDLDLMIAGTIDWNGNKPV